MDLIVRGKGTHDVLAQEVADVKDLYNYIERLLTDQCLLHFVRNERFILTWGSG
jgi:hypothetical protein